MPRLYLSPSQFDDHPVAMTFSFQVAQLKARSGAMDQLLARASRRVDGYARKRIGVPPITTVGTGGITAGSTSLPLASTLGFDDGEEEAVVVGPEIIPIVPGGVSVSSWSSPYPGTITLAQPVASSYSAGVAVQGCYQEISRVGNPSGRDITADWGQFDQGAQIALAHAPVAMRSMTRTVFLRSYPIIQIYKLEHALPISGDYTDLSLSGITAFPIDGYFRLPLGAFAVAGGSFRITYLAGFVNPPPDIQDATAWYAADELQSMKSEGAYEVHRGKVGMKYADARGGSRSTYELKAERCINKGRYRRTGP